MSFLFNILQTKQLIVETIGRLIDNENSHYYTLNYEQTITEAEAASP